MTLAGVFAFADKRRRPAQPIKIDPAPLEAPVRELVGAGHR
jgi:hypothetical protein